MLFPSVPLKLEKKITHGSWELSLDHSNVWVEGVTPSDSRWKEDKFWYSARPEHVLIVTWTILHLSYFRDEYQAEVLEGSQLFLGSTWLRQESELTYGALSPSMTCSYTWHILCVTVVPIAAVQHWFLHCFCPFVTAEVESSLIVVSVNTSQTN